MSSAAHSQNVFTSKWLKKLPEPKPKPNPVHAAALLALRHGLSPIPTRDKRPAALWTQFQSRRMSEDEASHCFAQWPHGIGIVCGKVSGNLEVLDFDLAGAAVEGFRQVLENLAPGLLGRLPIEKTPSGGYHVFARFPGPVPGNRVLAERLVEGKPKVLIETRGEGGQVQTGPTAGYEWLKGGFDSIPTLTQDEYDALILAAKTCNEHFNKRKIKGVTITADPGHGLRPGDDYNERGDVLPILERHGWQRMGSNATNIFLRRPGKDSGGHSASLIEGGRLFHVFSSNADPFEANQTYSRFGVYAILEQGGDFAQAASALAKMGFGASSDSWQGIGDWSSSAGAEGQTEPPGHFNLEKWRSDRAFAGDPPPRRYLVEGVFPLGQASLVAAAGGVGKTYSLQHLAHDIAHGRGREDNLLDFTPPALHFGGALRVSGRAVYIGGEDDDIEVHSRIAALGGPSENLFAVPFPSAGGAPLFFRSDPQTREPSVTAAWIDITRQIKAVENLVLVVIDPLQVFCGLDLNMPENAQFVCSRIAALASETGAAAILSHHFRKTDADSPEEARQAVRGSAGLVDGVRSVVAMWVRSEGGAKDKTGGRSICKALGEVCAPERVVQCAVVKANGKAKRGVTTFLRDENGILRDVTERVRGVVGASEELGDLLVSAIAEAARRGRPYKKTGDASGLYSHRHELGDAFLAASRKMLETLADELLQAKRIVYAQHGKSKNILDVPDGPFARGEGVFVDGHEEVAA